MAMRRQVTRHPQQRMQVGGMLSGPRLLCLRRLQVLLSRHLRRNLILLGCRRLQHKRQQHLEIPLECLPPRLLQERLRRLL